MAWIIFFHLSWLFPPPPPFVFIQTTQSLEAVTSKGSKEGEVAWKKDRVFFFVLIACQHLCADREAGWRRSLWGSVLVQLFKRFADWLPPASVREPVEQAEHIPPSDCSWWNTHVPLSSRHLAHAHASDPSHSNVLRPAPPRQNPRQGWDRSAANKTAVFHSVFLQMQWELMCVVVVSFQWSGRSWSASRRLTLATTSMGTLLRGSSMTSNKSRCVWLRFYFQCSCTNLNPAWIWMGFFFFLNHQMFKGPNQDFEAIYTAPSSAVCGVTLETNGQEYLITGNLPPLYLN